MVSIKMLKRQYSAHGLPMYHLTSFYDTTEKRSAGVYLCPIAIFEEYYSLPGPKPQNGSLSRFNNRNCFHPNLHGSAYGVTPANLADDKLLVPLRLTSKDYEVFINPVLPKGSSLVVQVNDLHFQGSTRIWVFKTPMPQYTELWGWGDWYCNIYTHEAVTGPLTSEAGWRLQNRNVRKRDPAICELSSISDDTRLNRSIVESTALTLSRLIPRFDHREVFGTLNDECAEQAVYADCNTSMLLRELLRLKKDSTALAKLVTGKIDHKTISTLFLSQKYGARLTVHDARLILDKVSDHLIGLVPKQDVYRVHSRKNFKLEKQGSLFLRDFDVTVVSNIWYRPAPQWTLDRSIYQLWQWDLFPTLQNVWDFLPYSFVVDWFLDVEGALKSLDNKFQWRLCQVLENTESSLYATSVDASILSKRFTGELTFTVYNRVCKPTLTARQFHFTPSLKNPIHHVAELTALIAQKR